MTALFIVKTEMIKWIVKLLIASLPQCKTAAVRVLQSSCGQTEQVF